MNFLNTKLKLLFLVLVTFIGFESKAQSISYAYVDPCTKQTQYLSIPAGNGTLPIVINYYGQVKTFTPEEITGGKFDSWATQTYASFGQNNPCQSVGVQTITASVQTTSNTVVTNIMNVMSALSNTPTGSDNTSSGDGGDGSSSGGGRYGKMGKSKEAPEEKKEETKTEESKSTGNNVTKTVSKGANKMDKPAILLTGDIVGIQNAATKASDSKITTSYIRVSGSKKHSVGIAGDFTVGSKVGNISVFKSWITTDGKEKHIDMISGSMAFMNGGYSNTLVYIRIDNVSRLTGLYGLAGQYGKLFNEPLSSFVLIAGGMFKGNITKKVDATVIVASVYAPYMKYYNASWFATRPMIIPFLNVNYVLTKAFRVGLTGGPTYSFTDKDILNYQLLFGAKLTL